MKTKIPHYDELPDLLTPADLAAYIRCSYDYAVKLCREGTVPSTKLGKCYYINKHWLNEYFHIER